MGYYKRFKGLKHKNEAEIPLEDMPLNERILLVGVGPSLYAPEIRRHYKTEAEESRYHNAMEKLESDSYSMIIIDDAPLVTDRDYETRERTQREIRENYPKIRIKNLLRTLIEIDLAKEQGKE